MASAQHAVPGPGARSIWSRAGRAKQKAEFALVSCLAATAAIAWLAGVDVVAIVEALAVSAGQASLEGLRFPIQLPVWAVGLLVIPSLWLLNSLARHIRTGRRRVAEGRSTPWPERAAPEALEAQASEPVAEAPEPEPAMHAPQPEPVAEAPAPEPEPDPATDYFEDVQFGVIWCWQGGLSEASLEAHCPACDSELVPAGGGSLSRGLFCESCQRTRAAGEHPREILPRVVRRLEEAVASGDWANAPERVEQSRRRAQRGLLALAIE